MIKKIPLKLPMLLLVAAVFLWTLMSRLLSGDDVQGEPNIAKSDELVSAIQPISADVIAIENSDGVISGKFQASNALTELQNKQLNELFTQAVEQKDTKRAIEQYEKILEAFPDAIEPHLNLASLYANNGELEKARTTLMRGFENNPKANLLFSSLQTLHGTLAASAYSKAVNTHSGDLKNVALPRAQRLVTTLDLQAEVNTLKRQLSSLDSISEKHSVDSSNKQAVATLESELLILKSELEAVKQAHTEEVVRLNRELATVNESLLSSQAAKREALARVVRAEQQAVENLNEAQVAAIESAQQSSAEKIDALQAQLQVLKDRLAASNNVAVATVSSIGDVDAEVPKVQADHQSAISLVQSWAKEWSAQNVDGYVSHYAENYTSSSSLTRQQWLAQRQQRLTNKAFINVKVSDFVVKNLDRQFSVTFSQNYKSNTVDDTVTKRLIFNKNDGVWSDAKIVNESIVAR